MDREPRAASLFLLASPLPACHSAPSPPSAQAATGATTIPDSRAAGERFLAVARSLVALEGHDVRELSFEFQHGQFVWRSWLSSPAGCGRMSKDNVLLRIVARGNYQVIDVQRAGVVSNWGRLVVIDREDVSRCAIINSGG